MSDIEIRQMPAFKKAYKKLPESHKLIVNEAIREMVRNPKVGDEKKGIYLGLGVMKYSTAESPRRRPRGPFTE